MTQTMTKEMSQVKPGAMQPMPDLLAVKGVSKQFLGLRAVDNVTLSVKKGEIISIIGPNGAGKTTFFNLLSGQLSPSEGEVHLRGDVINRLAPHARAQLGIGRTFQIAKPLITLSALENVMIGAFMRHARLTTARDKAMEVLQRVGLARHALRRAGDLTLSERRRLEVARALALEPELVLLDEVMAGLNQSEVGQVIELLQDLHANGLTFLIIEHNLKVVRAFSDRVVVLDRGRMIAEGSAEQILSSPEVIKAYLGDQQ
ncbi:ABC transporter ATP-binding protein [Glaciimonas sp. PAMC28666]|uniref:ABC transporter ATP-binding protein n=1 Tax=Glaciimonas sp. PAMC28666 TaxID=2807626 RepID=UPI001963C287|nr:ABC transporter ATP-binding protein [Glaciimonas sp. PAMC28666]QRX84947.1 ABC transporter ATP-binding protein [Glaciimonas sp. PAMC28666]